MPSSYKGAEPTCISGVTGASQQFYILEAEVSLTRNEWQKHPIVTGPEALLPPQQDPSVVGLLRVKEQQIAMTTVHWWQYRINQDLLISIHKLIRRLERQGPTSLTHSPFNSPIWSVRKSNGEWRLTVDYRGLNEVRLLPSAAVPDMLEIQYKLDSQAAKWYATIAIANAFFSVPLAAECRPQFDFTWRGVYPTICHGLIRTDPMTPQAIKEEMQHIDRLMIEGWT
ncbi:hypothetical protein QYF61_011754 [Mycteria americana]|uniref:Gag-pol polyprotein n=1 Tax=Mycteria americana TaxID=33587 RepID=A0AAN7NT88_MYCAM|nr:hypothetical protein QYF61_011754 [Mycteria americana]